MKNLMIILYIIVQCTWGILQTLLGAVVFLFHIREPHFFCHGAVVTGWREPGGLSLGMFVFAAQESCFITGKGKQSEAGEQLHRMLVHEYGHTLQSLLLGPFYLLVIGLPSLLWCRIPMCKSYRRSKRISYYSFYTEKWADVLGDKAVKNWCEK